MQASERHGMTQFEGIEPALAVALEKRGYSELPPVQKAVLDSELKGADANEESVLKLATKYTDVTPARAVA